MTKYKTQNFRTTFRNARKGMRLTLKSERNLRIHFFAGTLAIFTGYWLHFTMIKYCILILAISGVIVSEMFNSAIEFSLDAIFHNRYNKMVGMAKDIAAGAVMVTTIVATIIGFLLFISCIF